jgi:ParB family chromosome partitioning protein
VAEIGPNPFQPRKNFAPGDLQELQESLRVSGLLQPVTVRPASKGRSGYELIAGERRLRAATNLGWNTIPAIVKDLTDQEILELALVENLQRADLNPIEEAEGYNQLIREFGHTQQSVADMTGKDRSTIANTLRILQLPSSVQRLLEDGSLTAGQARPLLALEDQTRITLLAREIVSGSLSARDVERRVRSDAPAKKGRHRDRSKKSDGHSANVKDLEQQLRKRLQTDVTIQVETGNRGAIVVSFYSAEDLERVMDIMGIRNNPQ